MIGTPSHEVVIGGYIYQPPGRPFQLAEPVAAESFPVVYQVIEAELLAGALGTPVFPHTIRLDAGSPGALTVSWPLMNASPDKHMGYAVQWFAMAVTLLILTLIANSNLISWLKSKSSSELSD